MAGALVAARDGVALRTGEDDDVEFVQRGLANPELRYPMGSPVRSRTEMEDHVDGDSDGDQFVVCLADDPVPGSPETVERAGIVAVGEMEWRRPELGYWIAPEHQGEGVGRTAVAMAIDHSFRTYDYPAVEARVFDFNDASIGLLESLGFEREGRLRKRRFIDGAYRDSLWYGLLREDWDGPGP